MSINLVQHDQTKNTNSEYALRRLCVYDSQSGSGDFSGGYSIFCQEILLSNDSDADMTLRLRGPASFDISIIVKANEVLDERFTDFNMIDITATGAWRFLTRTVRLT